MLWNVNDRGFLPSSDPLISLPITNFKNTELIFTWENQVSVIPNYLNQECLREELICSLRKADTSYYHGFIDSLNTPDAFERAFLVLAFFASSYVNAPEGRRKTKLPKEITIPLARVSHLVSRNPIIDYTSYILYNWQRIDKSNPKILGNIEPLVTFTDEYEEKLFITTMVEFEYLGNSILSNLHNIYEVDQQIKILNKLVKKTIDSISFCFAKQFFRDFENLFYEGWVREPQSYPCDLLFQSPLLATLFKYLDIRAQGDYSNRMGKCLRPKLHQEYIQNISSIRPTIENYSNSEMRTAYNGAINEVLSISDTFSRVKDNPVKLSAFKF